LDGNFRATRDKRIDFGTDLPEILPGGNSGMIYVDLVPSSITPPGHRLYIILYGYARDGELIAQFNSPSVLVEGGGYRVALKEYRTDKSYYSNNDTMELFLEFGQDLNATPLIERELSYTITFLDEPNQPSIGPFDVFPALTGTRHTRTATTDLLNGFRFKINLTDRSGDTVRIYNGGFTSSDDSIIRTIPGPVISSCSCGPEDAGGVATCTGSDLCQVTPPEGKMAVSRPEEVVGDIYQIYAATDSAGSPTYIVYGDDHYSFTVKFASNVASMELGVFAVLLISLVLLIGFRLRKKPEPKK
jgi:hypothetical protein